MHFDVIVHAYSILRFDLHDLISHLYVFVVEYDVIIVKLRHDDVMITMQDRKSVKIDREKCTKILQINLGSEQPINKIPEKI